MNETEHIVHATRPVPRGDWVGFDFDGTLNVYSRGQFPRVGPAIEPMCDLVRAYLAEGVEVRIVTARAHHTGPNGSIGPGELETLLGPVTEFCEREFGRALPITSSKDFEMCWLYDDRAVTVETNTGRAFAFPHPDEKNKPVRDTAWKAGFEAWWEK